MTGPTGHDNNCDNTVVEATLERLIVQLRPELAGLLVAKRNFRVTVNVSAGHTWKIEVVKYLDGR